MIRDSALCDDWFARDKFLHFSACAAISGFTYLFSIERLSRGETEGAAYSVSFTALVGLGKELYDKKHKGRFSWKDLLWDGAGLMVGYIAFIR